MDEDYSFKSVERNSFIRRENIVLSILTSGLFTGVVLEIALTSKGHNASNLLTVGIGGLSLTSYLGSRLIDSQLEYKEFVENMHENNDSVQNEES